MKKNFYLLVCLVLLLTGCKDNAEVRSALGTYSYKSSGVLQIDTLSNLPFNEQGALEIVSLKNNDSILVTFNELLGGVYATRGSIQGDQIVLNSFTRTMEYVRPLEVTKEMVTIQVNGSGHVYDNNIVMNLTYTGMTEDSLSLTANNVQLIAKKNK